jgi:hypothetical protein
MHDQSTTNTCLFVDSTVDSWSFKLFSDNQEDKFCKLMRRLISGNEDRRRIVGFSFPENLSLAQNLLFACASQFPSLFLAVDDLIESIFSGNEIPIVFYDTTKFKECQHLWSLRIFGTISKEKI